MTLPIHSPARAEPAVSPLVKAIEARGRKVKVCDVTGFFGPGNRPILEIGIRVNVKGEEDTAVVDAHRYAQELARGTEAAKDDDLLREAKVLHALWSACREVDADGNATIMGAFPGPKWMRDNLTSDQLAALLNLYNDVRTRQSPWPHAFTDDEVENLAMLCADGADTEIPTAMLAGIPREAVAQYLILVSCKLRKARSELLAAQAQLDLALAVGATEEAPPEESNQ